MRKYAKPNRYQIKMIRCRGMDPKNYLVVKETYVCLYLLDVRFNKIKIIYKCN